MLDLPPYTWKEINISGDKTFTNIDILYSKLDEKTILDYFYTFHFFLN